MTVSDRTVNKKTRLLLIALTWWLVKSSSVGLVFKKSYAMMPGEFMFNTHLFVYLFHTHTHTHTRVRQSEGKETRNKKSGCRRWTQKEHDNYINYWRSYKVEGMKKGITWRNTGMSGTSKGHPYLILFNVKMLPDFTTPESKRGTNRKDMRQKGKYG